MTQDSAFLLHGNYPYRDTPTADELWEIFAPAIAAAPRVRVARDGRQYRRSWEQRLDPRARPLRPAAVRTYNINGETCCVVFDLDAKKTASRAAVLRDCERLTGWLSEAGCSYLVDESRTGGRHVYVLLDHPRSHAELSTLASRLRRSEALPTLDPGPLANLTEGCIRPPGAAHRIGGHQTLVTPLPRARAALQRPTSTAAWAAFLHQLPPAPATRLEADILQPAAKPQPVGHAGKRPLAAAYAAIAATGTYDTSRYPSPSEARAAVLLHALCRGWTAEDITTEVTTGRWSGLTRLYTAKYGHAYTGKALQADLTRATARLAESPLQISHTSATRPRGVAGKAARTHLRRWTAAISQAIASGRWSTRQSYGIHLVLLAVGDAARRSQTSYPAFGVRHLSMGAGTTLDWATVAALLRLLRTEDNPFLLLVDSERAAGADVYELCIPDEYLEHLPEDPDQLPPAPIGIHPAYSQLPLPAYRIYNALTTATTPLTTEQLAQRAHVPVRTVYATLTALREHHLIRRTKNNAWALGRRTLDGLARATGVARRLHHLVRTWRTERAAWRAVLGLPDRDYPPLRAITWPGVQHRPRPPDHSPAPPPAKQPADTSFEAALTLLLDTLDAQPMHTSARVA